MCERVIPVVLRRQRLIRLYVFPKRRRVDIGTLPNSVSLPGATLRMLVLYPKMYYSP